MTLSGSLGPLSGLLSDLLQEKSRDIEKRAKYISESNCRTDTTIHVRVTVNTIPVVKAEKVNDIDCVINSTKLKASGSAGSSYLWSPVKGLEGYTFIS